MPADQVKLTDSLSIAMRSYLSNHHLAAARYLIRQAQQIEENFKKGKVPHRIPEGHRAYVTSAVFASTAFLECAINELLKDAADGYRSYLPRTGAATVRQLGEGWRIWGRAPILEKYAVAWLFIKKRPMDKNVAGYSRVNLVLQLRNALMHFQPETLGNNLPRHRFETMLRHEFAPNPLMVGMGNPYFPDHCLGSPCAAWALASCKEFADHFFKGVRVRANYRRFSPRGPPFAGRRCTATASSGPRKQAPCDEARESRIYNSLTQTGRSEKVNPDLPRDGKLPAVPRSIAPSRPEFHGRQGAVWSSGRLPARQTLG